MKKIQSEIVRYLPFISILILLFFLFGKTLFPPPGRLLYGGDIYDAYFFWKGYLQSSILSGNIPFWNPYNFSGTPFLAHPNINIFYPFNWIFVIFPLNQSFAIYFFIHMLIAYLAMYWLVRQFSNQWGATAAALTYSLSGYFGARVYSGHLEYVDTAAWIPLTFGLTRRALIEPNRKNILYSSLGWVLIILSGNELFLLFTLEIVGLYIVYLLIISGKANKLIASLLISLKVATISLILAFGLSAVEFLPRFEFIRLSLRSLGVPYTLAASGSSTISTLRLFIEPFFYGIAQDYKGPWPNLSEYTYYVGLIPIGLIVIFILLRVLSRVFPQEYPQGDPFLGDPLRVPPVFINNVKKEVWFFILIIPIFVAISLGNNINPNIHELLWRFTPLYKSLRFPARHLYVVVFCASIAGGLILGGIKNKFFKLIILLIIIFDLISMDKKFFQLSSYPNSTFDQRLITVLKSDKDLYRLLPDYSVISSVRRDLDFGAATMYKIQTTSDYNSMVLARYYHFIDLLNKAPTSSIPYYNVEIPPPNPWASYINFLNIKYILSDKSSDAIGKETSGKFKLVLEGERWRLYENLAYLPRFLLVGSVQIYPSDKDLEGVIWQGDADLGKTVLLLRKDIKNQKLSNLDCEGDDRGEVKLVSYSPNKIILKGNVLCNSTLSSSEVYYPGWEAKVDNQKVQIFQSNFAFRAIYLPKGRHTVEFYYSPRIFYIGGVISTLTIIVLIYLLKGRRFRESV